MGSSVSSDNSTITLTSTEEIVSFYADCAQKLQLDNYSNAPSTITVSGPNEKLNKFLNCADTEQSEQIETCVCDVCEKCEKCEKCKECEPCTMCEPCEPCKPPPTTSEKLFYSFQGAVLFYLILRFALPQIRTVVKNKELVFVVASVLYLALVYGLMIIQKKK